MAHPEDPLAEAEFYIGYLPRAPRALARRMRITASALLLVAGALALLLVLAHRRRPAARFEYGRPVELAGRIREHPCPLLLVDRPGITGELPGVSSYPLVAPGKFGAAELVLGLEGRRVRLQGTLAFRDGRTLVEIVEGSLRTEPELDPGESPVAEEQLGRHTLTGEIVDSKCYLGVMNPGQGKTHRACAVRCISGGIPPVLVVREGPLAPAAFLLVSAEGRPVNREVLDLVAEPVAITGEVSRLGDLFVLRADPGSYRRVP